GLASGLVFWRRNWVKESDMHIKPNARLFGTAWLLRLVLAAPMLAQVQNASLTGLVTDPSAAVVAGASVTATAKATNLRQRTTTDTSGYYLFPALPLGTFTITVEANGFRRAVHDNVVLEVGQRGRDDFHLQVGEVTQVVEVTATPATLETQQATPGSVIQN